MRELLATGVTCAWCAAAGGQVVNGDFEAGSLNPWTIAGTGNGQTQVSHLVQYAINGSGFPPSTVLQLQVGQISFVSGVQEGVDVTQSVPLQAGVKYTISFDWAVQRDIMVNNADGGEFSVIVDGIVLQTIASGSVTGTIPIFGEVSATFVPVASGPHTVGFRVTRRFLPAGSLYQYIDNYKADSGATCYPDCNGDGNLNLADFGCFQTKFALGCP